ncbi:polysaccharide pyruvyl transferase family protein [Arthrobacter sp. USHLN218]|uniref:polysaccharide pyruvyl transferase family protein n=1 Tax=Arthrobacter sp. USHLN218 TaxID=3081232 RepID=UPI003018488B
MGYRVRGKIDSNFRVFVWSTGQEDNIGDSLLRRAYLDSLRKRGPLCIWTGSASSRFLSGLGVRKEDVVEGSFLRWYWMALKSALTKPTLVAMNAGEVPVSRSGSLRLCVLGLLVAISKMQDGGGVWIGAGVPNTHRLLIMPYRAVAKMSKVVRWRDRDTAALFQQREIAPDWAFSLGSTPDTWKPLRDRGKCAVLLRKSGGFPSESWIEWLRTLLEDHDVEPVFVVQVERDTQLATRLASIFAGGTILWEGTDHSDHEQQVRQLYQDCKLVVSDRLHALIVAATEGAIPIGWIESSKGKISRHFAVVDLTWVGTYEGQPAASYPRIDPGDILKWESDLRRALLQARAQLDVVTNRILTLKKKG